ncbi:MAG: CheR family methyltransferase [Bacteroidota bacterium]|nr:CheR family methyltransferase [Bacteroidota bacterium]
MNRSRTSLEFDFFKKEIETGIINFQQLNSPKNLEWCFIKKENLYTFAIPDNIKIQFINSEKLKPKLQYDAVIARNLTLNYNFKAHQNIFQTYLNLMKNHSILFIGANENFDWCEGIENLIKKDTTKPLYSYSRVS